MATGLPDHTQIVQIQGNYQGTLTTLAVDANGELYAMMRGIYGTSLKTIAVDANGQLIAVLKGASGNDVAVDASGFLTTILKGADPTTALKTVAVDTNGQLIAVLKGASGNDVAVDASGFLSTILKGYDGLTYRNVKVDSDGQLYNLIQGEYAGTKKTVALDGAGRIIAMLKGMYGTIPTDVAVDAGGNITVNLSAQDLAEVISRPKYGAADSVHGTVTVAANASTNLITVLGQGMIYAGYVHVASGTDQRHDVVDMLIDNVSIYSHSFALHFERRLNEFANVPFVLRSYDLDGLRFGVAILYGITFENSVKINYVEYTGNSFDVKAHLVYALV